MLISRPIPNVGASILLHGVSEPHYPCVPGAGSVDHLVLSLNSIGSIPPLSKSEEGTDASALGGLGHIKSLALSSNNLRSWDDINALADHCPMLETLNITGNPITDGQLTPVPYLRTHPHPCYDISEKHSRAIFVAKLPVLGSLNGGTVSAAEPFLCDGGPDATVAPILWKIPLKEREDCELFYLSYIAQVGYKTEEAVVAVHPRYQELRASALLL